MVLQHRDRVCMRCRVRVVSPIGSYRTQSDCLNICIGSLTTSWIIIRTNSRRLHRQVILEWLWTLDRTASRRRQTIEQVITEGRNLLSRRQWPSLCAGTRHGPPKTGSPNISSIPDLIPRPTVRWQWITRDTTDLLWLVSSRPSMPLRSCEYREPFT